ncbi:MAG: di-trans,poly-cis-decaprenylcistransferase [Candidatus Levybacteria bacterium]|nr:di-trans,poly-cis-decaprenylcistransferase [Candidatus Levybacteria bacterium]
MKMPTHVAFILDGNRRWSRERKLPYVIGHTKGYRRIEPVVLHAKKLGIKYLTFYAFSTENWNREKKEVEDLMNIFRKLFKSSMIDRLIKEGTRIRVIGRLEDFPSDIVEKMKDVIKETKDNTAITVNIAMSYGGRAEILQAIKQILKEKPKVIDEEVVRKYLYTAGQPDPDMVIRTGGDMRTSNFLTWQSVYSELYFTPKFWPDFSTKEFDKALAEFDRRERRFGK